MQSALGNAAARLRVRTAFIVTADGRVSAIDPSIRPTEAAALWGPLILVVTLLPLRLIKGLLIVLQYHHAAAEGRSAVAY